MKDKMIEALSVPKELFCPVPKLTWIGTDDLTCENCGGLLVCEETVIRFCTSIGILSIFGSALYIRHLAEELCVIGGKISGMQIE